MATTLEYDIKIQAGSLEEAEGIAKKLGGELKKGKEASEDLGESLKQQEANIKLLGGAINILGGAVETTVGALALIGLDEETVGQFEQAALGAIAFADGTKRIFEGYKELNEGIALARELTNKQGIATKILTGIQAAYNAVLNLNPIFLLVTVLAAVTAGIYLLTKALNDDTKAVQANNEALAKQKSSLADAAQFQLDYAKAAGKSAQEIRKAEEARTNAALDAARAELKAAKTAEDREKAAARIKDLKKQRILEEVTFEKTQSDELDAKRQELADKEKARIDELQAKRKKEAEDFFAFYLTLVTAAAEKNKVSLEKLNENIDKQIAKSLEKTKVQATSTIQSVNTVQEKQDTQLQNYLQLIGEYQKSFTKFLNSTTGQAIGASLNTAAQFASTLADAQDETTKEGFEKAKKFKIAEVVTSAIQSSFQAFGAAQQFGPILGPILGAAQVAAIAIASKKAISDIQSSKFGSTSAPSSSTAVSSGGGAAIPISGEYFGGGFLAPGSTTPPRTNQPEPVRAYVVTGDVSNGLEAETQINRRRALGPG